MPDVFFSLDYVFVGGIPLLVFTEWWLTKDKLSVIENFILSSFPDATFQGCNGLSAKYQVLGTFAFLLSFFFTFAIPL